MARVKIPAVYVGRAEEAVPWDAVERVFDAIWSAAWRSLPRYPEVIGDVWASWWDGDGLEHEADSLDEVGAAYRRFETGRIHIHGHHGDLPGPP